MTITRHTSPSDLPEYLTVEEYQAFLGISRAAAYDHVQSKKVHAVQFGRLWRIPKSAIVAANESLEPQHA